MCVKKSSGLGSGVLFGFQCCCVRIVTPNWVLGWVAFFCFGWKEKPVGDVLKRVKAWIMRLPPSVLRQELSKVFECIYSSQHTDTFQQIN